MDQRVLFAPDDGSLGPLLRVADDRLDAGEGYGLHEHRAVDVVAVVVAGRLAHRWGGGTAVHAGDVAVLRAGTGLAHDEVAGPAGARVIQCYLRPAEPEAAPRHEVHRAVRGWVDLRRPDARLWLAPAGGEVPEGRLRVDRGELALVWRLDTGRPAWADG